MSLGEYHPDTPRTDPPVSDVDVGSAHPADAKRPLHRLGTVRRQQGVSRRNVARRMNVDLNVVRAQEEETADISLTVLYEWQKILEVPVADLLVETDEPLSPTVLCRARLIKLMKTASAILEKAESNRIRRMAQMLIEQLVEVMPELKDVSPWHAVGHRRSVQEYGRIIERPVSDDVLRRF